MDCLFDSPFSFYPRLGHYRDILFMKQLRYDFEKKYLSPYASLSENAGGRVRPIEPCSLRTEYQRDRDRIIHSKSFRRLKHKTQVFLSPEGDHYRTRLTHTLEVSQIARTIARALMLNEDLCEAISLGHDLGHTPFGHAGERTLAKLTGRFEHNEQSLRVVELLEEDGLGLNLTELVRDGILNHTSSCKPKTLEGMIVNISDRLAYLNHDIDDAIRAGILTEEDLPKEVVAVLGTGKGKRIDNMVKDVVNNSKDTDHVSYSKEFQQAESELRKFLFKNLYVGGLAKVEEGKAGPLIELIFTYHVAHPEALPAFYQSLLETNTAERVVCDYVAGMTDGYAIGKFNEIYIPKIWKL